MDHIINSKLNLFGRYNYSPSSLDQRGPFPTNGLVLSSRQSLSSSLHTFTVALTEVITPAISNEVRANYSNQRLGFALLLDNFGGAAPLSDSLLFPSGYSSRNSFFQFLILGAGEYAQGNQGTREQRQLNFIDNLSLTEGSHQLKFGVDYRWLSPFSSPYVYSPLVIFTGVTSDIGGALSGKAALAVIQSLQSNALLAHNFSAYGHDTWRITPRLTVTYGLRWDVNPPLKGKNSANDPFTVEGLNNPATMTLAPRGTSLYETTYGNVAPRVGLAYQLGSRSNWNAILRAGFGVFYDLGSGSLGGVTSNFPYEAIKALSPVSFPLNAEDLAPPSFSVNPPVGTIIVADPHLKLPRSYQWNVALEQAIGSSQTLSLTYIGAVGRDLLRVTNLFNPNPSFLFVSVTSNTATSDYHALQLKFQRRLSRGWQALASYTRSHSIDIASTDAFATYLNTSGTAGAHSDRGNSDFDVRHAFTAGVTYDLPSPESDKLIRGILGGWSLDAFVFLRSAPPVDIIGAISFAAGTALAYRPNLNPGVPLELFGAQYPGGKIFNRAAFSAAPVGQQGNLGRNVLRGFGAWQADVAVQRQFHFTEKVGLRFRLEFFNIFNHPNFGNPMNSLSSPLFGRPTQTLANSLGSGGANGGLNPLYQIGGPRSIQFALKLQF